MISRDTVRSAAGSLAVRVIARRPFAARLRAVAAVPAVLAMPLVATAQTAAAGSIGVSISFSPSTIVSGGTSQMTIRFTVQGDTTGADAVLQETALDSLPLGLVVAAGASTACAGASAGAGDASITLAAGGIIPAAGCAYTVTVRAQTEGDAGVYFTNTLPANALQTTLGTNPAAASATLSVQPAVAVPDVAGQTQAAATAALAAAGFVVVVQQTTSTTLPRGTVIGTNPAAGTAQARQSTIALLVSAGPGVVTGGPISNAPGLNPAQVSVARALEQVCAAFAAASATPNPVTGANPLTAKQQDLLAKCSAIIGDYQANGDINQLGQTLTSISGRQVTAAYRGPMQFSAGQITTLQDRLDEVRHGAHGVSLTGLDLLGPQAGELASFQPLKELVSSLLSGVLGGGAGDEPGGLLDNRLGIFATGTLRRGTQSASDAESGFELRDTGLTLGVDYRLGTSYVIGIAGGYGRTTTGFDDAGGRLDAKTLSGQIYGSFFTEHFHLDAVAGYGHSNQDLVREIHYSSSATGVGCDGSTCADEATGTTASRVLNASLGAGGDFHSGGISFGPTVEVEYKQVRVGGFTEAGDSGLDLTFGSLTNSSLLSKVGGFASYAWNTRWAVVLPQLRARYLHEFQDNAHTQTVQFSADTLAGAADRSFLVYTDVPDRSYFDWKASVLVQLPYGIAGFVDYGGVEGLTNIHVRELNIGLRLER